MNIIFDGRQLGRLAAGFRALSGIRAGVRGADGGELCESGALPRFCALAAAGEGGANCAQCPLRAVVETTAGEGVRFLRCHAGACCAALPLYVRERREPLAWLWAGPFLEGAPGREPRIEAREAAQLRRLSPGEREGLAALLEALADSILLRGLIAPAAEGDLRRLERFLDEHYMEKLSLASVSAQLHIGRTRLCALAKELSGGQTLFAMVAQRRIDAAKALLARSDQPISAIAEAVGISDYNYFSKIFRAAVGASPSEFRKRSRIDLDNMV